MDREVAKWSLYSSPLFWELGL